MAAWIRLPGEAGKIDHAGTSGGAETAPRKMPDKVGRFGTPKTVTVTEHTRRHPGSAGEMATDRPKTRTERIAQRYGKGGL